jgi:TonB family protein
MAISPARRPQTDERSVTERGPTVPVLLISPDDQLWVSLGAALPGLRLEQHDTVADVVANWDPARPAVALVDTRSEQDLGLAVERLQTHSVALIPVAVVESDAASGAIALERRKVLFDHLTLPLDAGTAISVLERAGEESQARVALIPPGVSPQVAPRRKSAKAEPARPRLPPVIIFVAAGVLLSLVMGLGFFLSKSQKSAPTPEAQPIAPPASTTAPAATTAEPAPGVSNDQLERLLDKARTAMRDKRYIDPEEDSALAAYRSVLAYDPNNGEARQGLDRIAELLIQRADAALTAKDYPTALRAIEVARSIQPDHPRIAALDVQVREKVQDGTLSLIQAALQANNYERANTLLKQAEHSGTLPASEIASLHQDLAQRQSAHDESELYRLGLARLAQGRLLDPANDSAKVYLERLTAHAQGATTPELTKFKADYLRRLSTEARNATGRRAYTDAEAYINELRANGVQVTSLERDLAASRDAQKTDSARLTSLTQDRLASHRLVTSDSDNAVAYYRALQAADPKNTALPGLRDALVADLIDQARIAYAAGRAGDARPLTDAARDLGAPASTLAALVATPAVAAAAPVAAVQPKLLAPIVPDYPRGAANRGTEGWVEVSFVVDANGKPGQIKVASADPPGVFDASAMTAIKRASFAAARTADGQAIAFKTTLKIRFALAQGNGR